MKNLRIVVSAILLFVVLAGAGYAFTPPPPPPPPVPQNLGIYDSDISSFHTNATDQSACRFCHQSSGTNVSGGYNNTIGGVPTRHHNLVARSVTNPYTNVPFGCQDCHPSTPGIGNGILLDRSCTDCHNSTNFYADTTLGAHVGNISRPHHVNTTYDDANIGNPAADRQCNFCHGSFVNNYNDGHYKPTYATDFTITPFATWKATDINNPLTQVLFDSTNVLDLNKTWGGCESCHLGTVNNNNTGPTVSTSIGNNHNNHHREILGGNVFDNSTGSVKFTLGNATPFDLTNAPGGRTCFVCHVVTSSGSPYRFSIINPFTGETLTNAMELRDSINESTSAVEFVSANGNITFNGTGCEKCHGVQSIHNIEAPGAGTQQGLGHIGNNTDCYGCHNSWLPAAAPMAGAIIPSMDNVAPAVIASGMSTTLTITGGNFVNDVTNPDGSVTHYTSVVTVGGVTYTPTSITDEQIVVSIPALVAGIYKAQVVKGGDTLSNLLTLTVVPQVTVSSAILNGENLTISGNGFGTKPSSNAALYVSVSNKGNQIVSSSIQEWSDTQIQAQISSPGDIVTLITASGGLAKAPIGISPNLAKITVLPTTATLNTGGSQSFTASGSIGTITWSSSDPTVGTISPTGKFTAIGAGTATISAKNGDASGTAIVTVTGIKVTSPNGLENWKRGTTQTIKWTSVGNTGANVKVELLKGKSATTIASSVPNSGSYAWKISNGQSGTDYKIRITSTSNKLYTDTSDNNFQISK